MPGDRVGDQPPVARGVLTEQYGSLRDLRVGSERGFDLAGLDAVPAYLDLVVRPAQELKAAVAAPAREIAGAVHAGAGLAVGVGGETVRGQAGALVIPTGELPSRDVELADDACGNGPQGGVQDVGLGVVQGTADREAGLGVVGRAQLVLGGTERGLGRAVQMTQRYVRCVPQHGGGGRRRDDVATGEHFPERGEAVRSLVRDHSEETGGQMQGGDVVLHHQRGETRHVQRAGRCDDDGAAGDQWHPDLVSGGVKGVRCVEEDSLGRLAVPAAVPHQGDDTVLCGGHALGAAGGTGGVHGVRQLLFGAFDREVAALHAVCPLPHRRLVDCQQRRVRGHGRQSGRLFRGGEQEDGARVAQHVTDALVRVVRVDGEIGGAGLGDGQQNGDEQG